MVQKRGLGRYYFTMEDVSKLTGLSVGTCQKYARGRGRRFNPKSLESVVRFVVARRPDLALEALAR